LVHLVDEIKKGYPSGDKMVILFNDQNIVMDGQHRVSVIHHLHGPHHRIPIMRFSFTGRRHRYCAFRSNVYQLLRWLFRMVRRRIAG